MNCRNGEKFLKKSINSVISQTYKNWELIFFNNQSNDKSESILRKFKNKRIKYYKSNKILNLYEARNKAISKTKGKYITFIDTDDWWIRSKLKKQVNYLSIHKNINFIYSNLYIFNQKTKKNNLYIKKIMPNGNVTQKLLDNYNLAILTVMINKKIFSKKKFNKRYNIIGDFDFFINLSLEEKFFYLKEPLAFYRNHDENYSKKINIFTKELDDWSKLNFKKFSKLNYSLKKFKFFFYKIKIKKLLGWKL